MRIDFAPVIEIPARAIDYSIGWKGRSPMTDDEKKVKHLELIQGVVNRLAGNSFSMKGWSITLVSALFALAAKDANVRYAALALLPALCFWGLDAYYLRQERLFRKLYDAVRTDKKFLDPRKPGEPGQPIASFSMNTAPVNSEVDSWSSVLISPTIVWLHAPITIAVVAVIIYAALM
jgi:hypothetical protein